QFVKSDAKSVKIATRIDRTIHSSRLLGGHVGKRSRDEFGRLRRLALAGQSRGDTETCKPNLIHSRINEDVEWLYCVVNEPTPMHLAQCRSEGDPTAKERFQFHGPSKQSIEWLSFRVFEQQHYLALFLGKSDRPNRPGRIELVS